ncbi:hypothetical protein [Acetobacter syzygii]|uniref:hypothetical protein n=1 Tax=Acetobacter syzygii TaxID=146476 RepID=UPI0039E8B7A4
MFLSVIAPVMAQDNSLFYLMDGQNRLVYMVPVDSSAHQIAAGLQRLLFSL